MVLVSFLSIFSIAAIVYRITVFTCPFIQYYTLYSRSGLCSKSSDRAVVRKCQIGDWFIFYQLSKNIDPLIFKEIIDESH